ncbi:glycoside hydrolase family 3 C-terminal domain-containing protein [Cellulomonas sp. S1-8]|uniref:glycoside hydrolase family 3 C-terminal domain-containing protein n=1 Tax=Cellulomonas sp. S1-8 TaxID=2904790 RepID=UPI002242CAED|nr:glycoside hydrolase family 3 C-terminal domain-containing protein [Cellulomonas sp. S1-8]UZN04466.1 glycoside hydrolase family 3 C-terminal domain-containing protein [Cellulomonas sp. S1-8]
MADDARGWLDADLPVPQRAAALLARLTRTERVALLHQHAPGVPRLGLAAFRTGAEALHGVAWLGTATVFPQPVGLAATWDADLLERVGAVVGTELRAKHAADPTVSLNVWAPVVNPLRHPRWGRTEEGFSSDPHVTAWLAGAYARGLRGDHPTYWRTVPTLKHFLGYGAETDRAVASAQLRPRVLREYELPAYLGPVAAGVVGAVMPSYNLVNGRPTHLSGELLDELRAAARTSLLVVSDAAAPGNVVTSQRYHDDHVASHAALLRAGIDSFTDNDADPSPTVERITAALDRGLLTPDDVDRAVLRQLELRIRTGELDPDLDPWRVGADALDLPAHRALAREATARAVVVLENDGVLPLPPDASVAVVGPHASRVLHDWYSGTPPYLVGLGTALAERLGAGRVHVADGADRVALTSSSTGRGVRALADGTLVADADADADKTSAHDVTDWGDGLLTLRDVASDRLWSGAGWVVRADATRVGGWVVQESFRHHRHGDGTWSLQHVGSGRWVRVQHDEAGTLVAEAHDVAHAERFGVRLLRDGVQDVARAAGAADVVLVTAGNDPHLHGRETEDRPHLDLPDRQVDLWRAAADAAPRAVLLVVSSYPYVLVAATDDAVAVVWSSHGGQELGHGLVDVLLGDVEPTGRLAQEWPADAAQAGDLLDHDILATRATHWYSPTPPRYGLGHGLTYGDVRYTDLRRGAPAGLVRHGDEVVVDVTVENRGVRPARELVQVYVDAPGHRLPYPHRLVAHARVDVPAGAQVVATLHVPVADLAVWDVTRDRWVVEPGRYVLSAGPSSALATLRVEVDVDGEPVPPRDVATRPVRAADADDLTDVDLAETTREAGTCVQVRRGRAGGSVLLRDCVVGSAAGVELTVARTRPGTASVEVVDDATGTVLARADVPADGARHDWRTVTVPLTPAARPPLPLGSAPDDGIVRDLRLRLHGAARVATIRLT